MLIRKQYSICAGIGEARQLGQRTEERPPHQHRRRHEHQVLDDVHARGWPSPGCRAAGRCHAAIVTLNSDEAGDGPGEPPGGGVDGRKAERGAKHPPRRADDEEQRHDEGEHEVLHHVRAEQVVVAQVVQRAIQATETCRQRDRERAGLDAGWRAPFTPHAPRVEACQPGDPHDGAGVDREAGDRGVGERVQHLGEGREERLG